MSDHADLIRLAKTYIALSRCPGGRLIHRNYACLHCDHDPSAGGGCKAPTPDAKKRLTFNRKSKVWEEMGEWEP
jgi:hypothetical protein